MIFFNFHTKIFQFKNVSIMLLLNDSLQALQNLQRILQSQLANVNPIHLQQAIQRQQVPESLNDVTKWKIFLNDYNLYLRNSFFISETS